MASPSSSFSSAQGDYGGGRFKLVLRQQPRRARMCGFSDIKDRRLIDPPPVLQLIFYDAHGREVPSRPLEAAHFICHASLYAPDTDEDRNVIVRPSRGSSSADLREAITSGDKSSRKSSMTTQIPSRPPPPPIVPAERKSFRPWDADSQGAETLPLNDPKMSQSNSRYANLPRTTRPAPSGRPASLSRLSSSSHLSSPLQRDSPPVTPPQPPRTTSMESLESDSQLRMEPDAATCIQTLVGVTVASCEVLADIDGQESMFFIFHDLSVRPQGLYRLKFVLVHMNFENTAAALSTSLMSDVFEVTPPKAFPGMTESTALSKCLARQSVPIHIRKDWSQSNADTKPPPGPSTS
ncbi:velvet factor [Fimicolochytrium jonesii]|uniref:velvet factor n=1 Tax=Fimicolochytrium jonesii TaxID=1396493 RepID=UPI0022FF0CD4|nr:velvet factor [Fimicolochytrium jonesii]KAI8826096.1 velvet factor [Fimicolochytrium jonesii]